MLLMIECDFVSDIMILLKYTGNLIFVDFELMWIWISPAARPGEAPAPLF